MKTIKKQILEDSIKEGYNLWADWAEQGDGHYYPLIEIMENNYSLYMITEGDIKYHNLRKRDGEVIKTIILDDIQNKTITEMIDYFETKNNVTMGDLIEYKNEDNVMHEEGYFDKNEILNDIYNYKVMKLSKNIDSDDFEQNEYVENFVSRFIDLIKGDNEFVTKMYMEIE